MLFGSLFAGIGGLDLGLHQAGMRCAWQVEIDAKCRSVLSRHFPDTHRWTDVRAVRAMMERRNGKRVSAVPVRPELICGGFPCQDLSVAGRRAGLAGERSGLWFVFRRIVAIYRPGWVLIENVPGLRSSNGGRDLGTILGALGQLGYRWAYRSLDAQYFGLAQRRERVFIVASLGDRPHPGEILFDADSLPGNLPPSRETGARVAASLTSGVASRRSGNDGESETFVTHTLRAEGHDASEDGTGRGTPIVPVAYQCHGSNVGPMGHLRAGNGNETGGVPFTIHGTDKTVNTGMRVRRLTPLECERLQGFPDQWTRFDADGNEISDSARYRMLGNAVAVPVARWIGERIMQAVREHQ